MSSCCVLEIPVNTDISKRRYSDHFPLLTFMRRAIRYSRIIFILNVFAIVVSQLGIAFGLTSLITQQINISHWVKTHSIFLYVITAIYFVLEIVWAFVKPVSTVFPWNLVYLMVMTLLSSYIIGAESEEYTDDVPFIAFAFIWTMLQIIVSFAIFIMNDFTESKLTRIVNVVYAVTILVGQIAFFLRNQTKVALLIAGIIGFPSTCYLLVKEVKWVFGQGKYFYPENNVVRPARNIYGYCWSLFLTILWVYAYSGIRPTV
ncbi:unnamed protein product [Trichobilharzia szidati]|nr:unnamed protein product [Trichobilharzia szidati]